MTDACCMCGSAVTKQPGWTPSLLLSCVSQTGYAASGDLLPALLADRRAHDRRLLLAMHRARQG